MINREDLYEWQKKALDNWAIGNKQGIVQAPTGVGKTLFALFAMQQLKCSCIVIVPTIVLAKQWKEEVLKNLDIEEDKIGLYYSAEKNMQPITIAVINSVREQDLSQFQMVVCDEIHRYASIENIKPLERSTFKIKLGITATLTRDDGRHSELLKRIGPVVYEYDQKEAIDEGILNKFQLVNVGVEMPIEEKHIYDEVDLKIRKGMASFRYNINEVTRVAKDFRNPDCRDAQNLLRAINTRRSTTANCSAKVHKVIELVDRHKGDKIIIFNEFIGMAEKIYERLIEHNIRVGIYHSESKDLSVIKDFSEDGLDVLVAVKSLNEGLNVKSANVGIMVSANSVRRNTIQRLGRIIRKVEGKKAHFYQLYCLWTKEAKDNSKRTILLKDLAETVTNE